MNRLTTLLVDRHPVLFDGGMGTLLQERGLDAGGCGELWNVDRSAVIRSIHEEYADAGATFLTTNTFGGTRSRLSMHGLGGRVHELNSAAAALAHDVAARRGLLVAGDLGPTGELLAPLGAMDAAEAEDVFAEQMHGLVAGGIDVVLIETMSDLAETTSAVRAARAVAPSLPVIATMSFDTNLRTMMGVSPEAAVIALSALDVEAVGANCGRGPADMEDIAEQLAGARVGEMLLVAQSNAGLPQLVGDRFAYDVAPAVLADHALSLQATGVDLIGACCGSTPAHIAAMHEALSVSARPSIAT